MSKLSCLGEQSELRENKQSEPCKNERASSKAVRSQGKELSFLSPAPRIFVSSRVPLSQYPQNGEFPHRLFIVHPLYTNNHKETCLIIDNLYLRLKLHDRESLTADVSCILFGHH